ncbi:MAG: hypothetical protein MAG715_01255 [Methanonatronarchaeales archaeon]|nr:hypothetical protein [Methanonatronarchaeales archaeon]
MRLDREWAMVAVWVVSGAIYALWIALSGERGVAGMVGLMVFVLVVLLSPRIVDLLERRGALGD